MSRFLLFFYLIALSTHSIASRNPYADRDDYGVSFGFVFLCGIVPILLWVLGKYLQDKEKTNEVKRFEKEKILREHTDRTVKEFAEKNKVQEDEKSNSSPQKEEPKPIVINPEPIKGPSKAEEKPQLKKEFPKLTDRERKYALIFLGNPKFIDCPKCGYQDDLSGFGQSSAGDRFRFCNKCNTHFEPNPHEINQFEQKLIDVFYLRCPACKDVIDRINLIGSDAGYDFKKCPSCFHNFQTYGLNLQLLEQIDEKVGDIKFEHDSNIRLALKARREIDKEKRNLKIKKKYSRTTPHLRERGWKKKPHKKNRYDTRRRGKVKWVVDWYTNRQPREFI